MLNIKYSFLHTLLKKGKKGKIEKFLLVLARKILLESDETLYFVLLRVIRQVRTTIGFKNLRLRGFIYNIPFFLKKQQQVKVALKELLSNVSNVKTPFVSSLLRELQKSELEQGNLITKRKKIFKLANQNKVFAHYR